MKTHRISLVLSSLLVMFLGITVSPAFSQEGRVILSDGGLLSIHSPVRVGKTLLQSGDYQVQHVIEGERHFIVFRKTTTEFHSWDYPPPPPPVEVARIACQIEPLGHKAKRTVLQFATNSAGERTVQEIEIRGENVRHLF